MTLVAYTMTNTRERFDQLLLVCVLSLAYHGLSGGVFTILTGGQFRVQGPYGTMIGDNNDLGVALTMVSTAGVLLAVPLYTALFEVAVTWSYRIHLDRDPFHVFPWSSTGACGNGFRVVDTEPSQDRDRDGGCGRSCRIAGFCSASNGSAASKRSRPMERMSRRNRGFGCGGCPGPWR